MMRRVSWVVWGLLAIGLIACATVPLAPRTPTEMLFTLETGVNAAITSTATLYQDKLITAADVQNVEKQTDVIDGIIMAASKIITADPQACSWMFASGKPSVPPTQAEVTNCNTAMQQLMDAQTQLLQLQQALNAKKGGA